MDFIKMALNDLGKRKLRTFITIFSVSIGAMLLVVLLGLGTGIQNTLNEKLKMGDMLKVIQVSPAEPSASSTAAQVQVSMGVQTGGQNTLDDGPKIKFKKIDKAVVNKMKKIKGVSEVQATIDAQVSSASIDGKDGGKAAVIGVDTDNAMFLSYEKTQNKVSTPIKAGELLKSSDEDKVLVGEKYLKKMGISDYSSVIGKKVAFTGNAGGQNFTVEGTIKGVINSKYSTAGGFVVPASTASKILGMYTGESDYFGEHGFSSVSIQCSDFKDVTNVNTAITKMKYTSFSYDMISKILNAMYSIIKGFLGAAGVLVLVVSGFGVVNTMTMNVLEKVKYIGIMKAVGASKKKIKRIFVIQAGIIGFLGGVLGTVFALIISAVINNIMAGNAASKGISGYNALFQTPIKVVLIAVVFSTIVSLIAGLIPSEKAARLDPVVSLSYE